MPLSLRCFAQPLLAVTASLSCIAAFAAPPDSHPLPPLPTTPAPVVKAPAAPDHFSFAVAGDNRAAGHGEPQPPSLDRICTEIGYVGPALTLWTGDTIEGYDDTPADAVGEYNAFLASASKTGAPFYNSPGNHEFAGVPAMVGIYQKKMGPLYGSFNYGNSHFIALNACPISADGKSMDDGHIDDAQWAWMEADLAAHQSATNRFVFLHYYPFGPGEDDPAHDTGFKEKAERDRLHALFIKYHVRAVFAGHQHRYWHGVHDGIDYFIAGGGGAPLDAAPEDGGFFHFVLVNVDGDKISTATFQPWNLTLRPRTDAERSTVPHSVGSVIVSNSNNAPVTARHIVVSVQATAAQAKSLHAVAKYSYKGKTKDTTSQIIGVSPDGNKPGRYQVTVEVLLTAHRATEIDIIAP